jgi:tRNA(Ile)-lysidine synthase
VTGPPAATAAVRVAVRRGLADLPAGAAVAAAVSGGADSLALAAALAFERPGSVALVVDHGLQAGSADVAARAAEQCREVGLDAAVLSGEVAPGGAQAPGAVQRTSRGPGGGPGGGPEAAARALRYRLLEREVGARGLAAVLLGHTLDDQAETVLLGLARGSGGRALAGMPPVRGPYRRPLLGLDRVTVRAACTQAGLVPVEDPHNADPAYARVRVRRDLLPALDAALGPGLPAALARTAALLREDADALDALAPQLPAEPSCAALAALLPALRGRALKCWAEQHCSGAVTSAHVAALRSLVDGWRGQGAVALPGGVRVERVAGRLRAVASLDS